MRAALLAAAVLGLACGGVAGQEKKGTAKADTKYLSVKELDANAKAALDVVKKRGDGYVDKGLTAFGEVVTKADLKNAAARQIAGQAAFFMGELYHIKLQGDLTPAEREKLTADRLLWINTVPLRSGEIERLAAAWETIRRDWSLEDMKKK